MSPNNPPQFRKLQPPLTGLLRRGGLSIEQLNRSSGGSHGPVLFPVPSLTQAPQRLRKRRARRAVVRVAVGVPAAVLCVFTLAMIAVATVVLIAEQRLTPIEQQVIKELRNE